MSIKAKLEPCSKHPIAEISGGQVGTSDMDGSIHMELRNHQREKTRGGKIGTGRSTNCEVCIADEGQLVKNPGE